MLRISHAVVKARGAYFKESKVSARKTQTPDNYGKNVF